MSKTEVISAKIGSNLKYKVEQIFRERGLTTAQAIMLFYKQVDIQHDIPFNIKVPNKVTKKALEDAKARCNLESFNTTENLFEDLGI